MFQNLTTVILVLASTISQQTHIISFAFCPFIFGGSAIFAIYKWIKLEAHQKREMIWSISMIILAVLVLVFVGLNTFLWLNDLMFYLFIAIRFTSLVFLLLLANPYIKWAPFKGLFITKQKSNDE
ncbi:MAG: hypothetical protein FK730_02120 [Asgard group archaeon]|nr:hypothetical protein [Asgard group archaeon]